MSSYEIAAGSDWGCADDSPSISACADRCLDRTCDPSGLEMGSGLGSDLGGGGEIETENETESEDERAGLESEREPVEPTSSSGCGTSNHTSHHIVYHHFVVLALLWIYLTLINSRRSTKMCDSRSSRYQRAHSDAE